MNVGQALGALLVFPGLLYAAPMAWLLLWIERKTAARLQSRIGPPFYQPFFDFVKLAAKRTPRPAGLDGWLLALLPVIAASASLGALALLPVFPGTGGYAGDVFLWVALLEIPPLCAVLAGFASRSLFGQVGATREALLTIAYNVPLLTALAALAANAGSLSLTEIVLAPGSFVRVLAAAAIVLTLPVKLRLNPFSLANAEQEIYTGPTTEFGGIQLALWDLAHGLEWVVLSGWVVILAWLPRTGSVIVDAFVLAGGSVLLALVLATLAAATARLKLAHATRFYWRWGFGVAVLALIVSWISHAAGG